jgi:HEAT repeat protein
MGGHPDNRTQAELLHDLLNEGSPNEQRHILARLTAIGEAEALDAVVDYLRDGHPSTAGAAFSTLRVLATKYIPRDRYSLTEAVIPFLTSQQWRERLSASRILNTHPNELAIDSLRNLVDEARQRVYDERHNRFSPRLLVAERTLWEGILALANCGRLSVMPDIDDMMTDPYLRPIATRALGVIGSETQRPRLDDLAEDEDVRVRDAAQWSLALMDERAAQFQIPPHEQPAPPPDRLSTITWAHRQLFASDDTLVQFLVVRFAVEHLLLDEFLAEGRTPIPCQIELREYDGPTPPTHEDNDLPTEARWVYHWQGPDLTPLEEGDAPACKSRVVITMPDMLMFDGEGTIAADCWFDSYLSRGWHYHIEYKQHGWTFAQTRQTWSST